VARTAKRRAVESKKMIRTREVHFPYLWRKLGREKSRRTLIFAFSGGLSRQQGLSLFGCEGESDNKPTGHDVRNKVLFTPRPFNAGHSTAIATHQTEIYSPFVSSLIRRPVLYPIYYTSQRSDAKITSLLRNSYVQKEGMTKSKREWFFPVYLLIL
jgi:hypothetical protein